VDRKLIANLFVSYFSQRRPRDVLDIIARTLQFTDPERVSMTDTYFLKQRTRLIRVFRHLCLFRRRWASVP
jgi:hypothetical protein